MGAAEMVALWNITDDRALDLDGARCPHCSCSSPRECWEAVFLPRFWQAPARPGEARPMAFVKAFGAGASAGGGGSAAVSGLSREQLLAQEDTFFVNWLRLAG